MSIIKLLKKKQYYPQTWSPLFYLEYTYKIPEKITIENVEINQRVRRGPDWVYGNQDCNEEGTTLAGIISFKSAFTSSGSSWVYVKWDNGEEYDYRIGPDKFDLVKTND